MPALRWKLKELYPKHGDLLTTLDEWFESPMSGPLRTRFHNGQGYHPGQIRKWRERQKEGDPGWRLRTVQRLFAVRKAVGKTAIALHTTCEMDTWKLLNCMPAGGRWSSTGNTGIGGQRCRSWLCPWCYLRKLQALRKVLIAPTSESAEVQPGQVSACLGLSEPFHLLTFTMMEPRLFTDKALFQKFRLGAEKVARRGYSVEGKVYTPTGKAEFGAVAIRTLAPLVHPEGKIGMRVGFIHNGQTLPGEAFDVNLLGTDAAPVLVYRQTGLTAWQALRAAQPYPVGALSMPNEPIDECKVAAKILLGMKGLSAYGTVRSKRAPAPKTETGARPPQHSVRSVTGRILGPEESVQTPSPRPALAPPA